MVLFFCLFLLFFHPTGPVFGHFLDLFQISSTGCKDCHYRDDARSNGANYFTSSDPHHDMLGGGCQVRVVIENMMGRMENLRTLISGFLGLVILVRWALVTMFLS